MTPPFHIWYIYLGSCFLKFFGFEERHLEAWCGSLAWYLAFYHTDRVQRAFPKKSNGVDHHLFKHWTIYVDNATLLHCKESVLWDKAAVPVGTLDLGLSAKYDGTVSDCWLYLECLNITLFYWTGDLSQLVHYTFTKSVFWHSPDWHL